MENPFVVELPRTPSGFVSRECPSCLTEFFLGAVTVANRLACPYCARAATTASFLSPADRAFVRARQVQALKRSAADVFRSLASWSRPRGRRSVHVEWQVQVPTFHDPEPPDRRDAMRSVACPACAHVAGTHGAAIACPICGAITIAQHWAKARDLADDILHGLRSRNGEAGERASASALTRGVSEMERLFKLARGRLEDLRDRPRTEPGVLQSIKAIRRAFERLEVDVFAPLDQAQAAGLDRLVNLRHLDHNGGVVDEKCVAADPQAILGRPSPATDADVRSFFTLLASIFDGLAPRLAKPGARP